VLKLPSATEWPDDSNMNSTESPIAAWREFGVNWRPPLPTMTVWTAAEAEAAIRTRLER